ncbi:MAG: DegT/DnrJ/EryC1/StrS family aminotransferase [Candidatus Staskawiczbacteria bacterium]|nr:DegT/DnrJ/EryC1/StrS family aminotransferase [Candidatus Staskawiczbacteria bacterium]
MRNKIVSFLKLKIENDFVKKEVLKKISELADNSAFTLGPPVQEFEKNFSRFCGAKFCLGVSSGTDALRTALLACGVISGDEVITTPITYTSTSLAIAHCGAKPVFVDVLDSGNIDPSKIESAITKRTKAILVVHMYGNICDMDKIRPIAKRHGLFLIDDCAHSQGASYKGKMAGSLAEISCFSFYPTKNLGAWGDAGAITTDNKNLLDKASLFKDRGEAVKNYSKVIGYNSRLDTIQAIVLNEKLKHLKVWNKRRSDVALKYIKALGGVGDIKMLPFSRECSYYNFPIMTSQRKKLMVFLEKMGVKTLINYPLPVHLQECFGYLGYKRGDLPKAESFADSVMSLPFHSFLTGQDQNLVIRLIKEFFDKNSKK